MRNLGRALRIAVNLGALVAVMIVCGVALGVAASKVVHVTEMIGYMESIGPSWD